MAGLSVLQLLLLVAAHRLQRKGQPMCNFEVRRADAQPFGVRSCL